MGEPNHPTKELLIVTTSALLEEGVDPIHVDDVLGRSGVSKGSLYHHFEDFQDLLNVALVRRFAARVDLDIAELTEGFRSAGSAREFRDALIAHSRTLDAPGRSAIRYERAAVLGLAAREPRLMALVRVEQQRRDDALTEVWQAAADRGWLDPGVDPAAMVLLMSSWAFGHILSESSERPLDPDSREALARIVLERLIHTPND